MTICARGTCSKKETRSEKNRSEETHTNKTCEATGSTGPLVFGVGAARGTGVFHLGDAGRQRLCVY